MYLDQIDGSHFLSDSVHGGLTSHRSWTARVQARIDGEKKARKEKARREKAAKSDGAGEGTSLGAPATGA